MKYIWKILISELYSFKNTTKNLAKKQKKGTRS